MVGFDIKFDVPSHGWLPVVLGISRETYEFAASYVLSDPVSELALACLHLLRRPTGATVRFWLEPRYSILDLECASTSTTVATFKHSTTEDGKRPESVISATVDTSEFCRLVARRLRTMYELTGADRYSTHDCAGKAFPDETISSIYDLLRSRRNG